MSFNDEYQALRKKRKKIEEEEAKKHPVVEAPLFTNKTAAFFAENSDIAPVTTTKKKETVTTTKKEDKGLDFFQKGAFEDGYQFGDVTKAILGTAGDVGAGVIKGASRLVEGVVDAGMYGVAAVADKSGNDSLAGSLRKKAQVDFVGDDFKKTDEFLDKYSVLGRTGDAVAEGIGQVGAIILTGGAAGALGAGAAATTAATTGLMGISSFGSGVGEAYEGGATDKEAMTYGAIKGVVDAGSELIFGGLGKTVKALGLSRGLSNLDDVFAKKLSSKIANQTAKNLVEFGVKASAEGVEEVLAGLGSAVGKKLTYMEDEELRKLVKDEKLLEQFVVGAVTSGISQSGIVPGMKSGSLKESNEKGRDFIDGLSANEQKVIDKEFENRIAEQGDKELTKREKSKIYDEVIRAMEEGEISIDTIEEVLGGDTYKAYRDTIDSEDSVLKEYEELGNKSNATLAEQSRYAELKAKLDDIKQNSQRDQLRAKLGEDVFNLVKGDRLVESYNERSRRGQAFEADLTQYDEKQKAVIQKAADSGILNNTRRTHKFVDMIAKISADKGVLFDFTNNEKLKESGFAVDGKIVNGYVTKDGITLNIQSAKALNSVVGHEITHVLEGTELYDVLQNTVVEYAKTKGDYQGRYDSLTKLYEGVADANVDAELTADLVGDYLFTDSDFINNLSVNHRNVFQKVYDEIKYLAKVATAGSKEARELEKVKRAFEKAYKESGKAQSETKYSISDSVGKGLTKEQQEYFKDSKVRDENGNLKVMYHGTERGGFHTFEQRFSDDDTSFFFVDSPAVAASYSGSGEVYTAKTFDTPKEMNRFLAEIGYEDYEVVGTNGKYTLYYDADDVIATSDSMRGIYEEFCNFAGVGEGEVNYKVYLNLKNPLVVDAKGRPWNKIGAEFSQEVYDRFQSLTDEEKDALRDLAEWEDFRIFNSEIQEARDNALASAYRKMGEDVNIYDLFSAASDNFSEESIRENSRNYLKTRDYAQRAKEQGYDGVIFNNIVDIGGYGNGSEGAATVAIAFDSNQIKSVANAKPTADADIRYSLGELDNAYQRNIENNDMIGAEMAVERAANLAMPNSKIRGKDGNLIPVYHGTRDMFYEFDTSVKGGVNGTAEGFGIYTSDNPEITEAYGDRQIKMYANITKPATSDKKTISTKTLAALIKDTCKKQAQKMVDDGEYDSVKDALMDTWVSNYVYTYDIGMERAYREVANSILQMNDNDMAVIQEVMAGLAIRDYGEAFEFYHNSLTPITGFDGYITQWENTSIGKKSNIILAFDSSQLKSADPVTYDDAGNIIPLSERFNAEEVDIRYSLSAEGEQPLFKGGDFHVYGKDIALEAPVRQDVQTVAENATVAPVAPTDDAERIASLSDADAPPVRQSVPTEPEEKLTRSGLHQGIVDNIKSRFKAKGFDFDKVLKNAKNLSTFATVDNTPQRVMEKALGYKEGQLLSDITVNQVAQNETEGIKWLNSYTDRKSGVLAQISKQYNIKPGSKESAAAQMYAEGFYVAENNDIIEYGDAELAKDFPDAAVRANIKGLARDPRIRAIYDETLSMINESRTRNAYPEIQRLDNYFLHFRAMGDTFSRLGLPFNPNDIKAKDLPTDLNGVTADLKPGQPYFASAMHRTGKRTSFDLLGGLERYLSSAKNQIYHIDDIQTLRALRNYIADIYGQAKGLENLDELSQEAAWEKIQKVYDAHLSTFAKFLNDEANIIAGKTSLLDRGIEGKLGRRGITFLDELNKQAGANMVGYNISSSLTNFIPVAQTLAKASKFDFVKAFAQTVAHKVSRRSDGFAENSPVMIRRKGADRFYRTAWQKMSDPGYAMMGAVDSISTELIARTKYNELVRKGMDSQTAHYETDKWVSRLMGDRSLGQQPQLFDSKMFGLITKFQLEVRNQLDSQFYDTIQEAKVSNEHIENELARNAKTAAKVTSTFVQLAVVQHLFGKAFESVAGYNPAFDIIEVLMTAFGFDDDEESEDTALDNIEQGFLALLDDLPYTSIFTGGRIPIASVLPVEEFVTGQDEWGNEKSRVKTALETAPYLLPGGYGQIKKTAQGLSMFSEDHPIAGSYTDSGNLRFPVEDTLGNRVQAGIFGQWASENARDYFDNERQPLKEKQIQEFIDVEMPIRDYWDYREGLNEQDTLEKKFDYIAGLDLSVEQKNILINNVVDRKDKVDMSNYDDFITYEEFDFYTKNKEKYEFLEANGVSYYKYKYSGEDAKERYDAVYSWYNNYPEKVVVAKAVTDNMVEYRSYTSALNDIRADKDANGKSINGTAKSKKVDYINSLDLDYGQRLILFKNEYNADDTYNEDIIDYLNGRDDLTYKDRVNILKELGFTVSSDGTVTWD